MKKVEASDVRSHTATVAEPEARTIWSKTVLQSRSCPRICWGPGSFPPRKN